MNFSFVGFIQPIPEHGFSFHFEMYKTPKDQYYLQLFLRQPNDENPKAEEIKECGKKCSIPKFYEIYDELIPDSFEKECKFNDDPNLTTTTQKPDPTNPTKGKGAAASIGNGRVFSIVLCSLWFVRKLFGKVYQEVF